MKYRTLTLSWLVPLITYSIFTTQFFFFLFSSIVFLLTKELIDFRKRKFLLSNILIFTLLGIQQVALYFLFFIYEGKINFFQIVFFNVCFIFINYFLTNIIFIYYYQKKYQKLLTEINHNLFISFYIFFIFNHIVYLKYLYRFDIFENSYHIPTFYLFTLFAIYVSTFFDVFAYVFGFFFGKNNKLNIEVSPRKSWAGLIGGTLFSGFSFYIVYLLFSIYYPEEVKNTFFQKDFFWQGILLTFGLGLLSQVGDLFASLHKRSQNIKDSSSLPLLKGHGGVYDRVDSVIINCLFCFYIFYFYYFF